ncbi:DUF2188 domain-containing protein [Kocuria arenosa]|uniref:DUF2188 domain-containing protein n=1 Tax=Kocuria arenosa TaxID=3071446 RepID=UPI0034D3D49B
MPHPEDRIIAPCLSGCWEVRAPGATRTGLHAPSRSEALQWAWNITRSTGGQVIAHRSDGSSAQGPAALAMSPALLAAGSTGAQIFRKDLAA